MCRILLGTEGQLLKHPVGVEKVRLESILFVLWSASVAGSSDVWFN
jgi:hypothetical protein